MPKTRDKDDDRPVSEKNQEDIKQLKKDVERLKRIAFPPTTPRLPGGGFDGGWMGG